MIENLTYPYVMKQYLAEQPSQVGKLKGSDLKKGGQNERGLSRVRGEVRCARLGLATQRCVMNRASYRFLIHGTKPNPMLFFVTFFLH